MASKVAFLALPLFALLLVISSDVRARDLSQSSSHHKHGEVVTEENGVMNDAKYGGYGGNHGGGYPGHGGYPDDGGYGGSKEKVCRFGCCGGFHGGHCRRCCSFAGEAVDAQTETTSHN